MLASSLCIFLLPFNNGETPANPASIYCHLTHMSGFCAVHPHLPADRLQRHVQCLCVSVLTASTQNLVFQRYFGELFPPNSVGLFQIFYNTVQYICQSAFCPGTPAILADILKMCVHWSSFLIWDVQSFDFGQIHSHVSPTQTVSTHWNLAVFNAMLPFLA